MAGYQQQDAHELLMYLMDKLHEDCNRVAIKPPTENIDAAGKDQVPAH